MPIPQVVGQLNKVGLNRVTKRVAPWMPGLGVVVHRGRRSGKMYETPVNVFGTPDGYVLAQGFWGKGSEYDGYDVLVPEAQYLTVLADELRRAGFEHEAAEVHTLVQSRERGGKTT